MKLCAIKDVKSGRKDRGVNLSKTEQRLLQAVMAEAVVANRYPMKGSFRVNVVKTGREQLYTACKFNLYEGMSLVTNPETLQECNSASAVLQAIKSMHSEKRKEISELTGSMWVVDKLVPILVLQSEGTTWLAGFVAEYDLPYIPVQWEANVLLAFAYALGEMFPEDEVLERSLLELDEHYYGKAGYLVDEMKTLARKTIKDEALAEAHA